MSRVKVYIAGPISTGDIVFNVVKATMTATDLIQRGYAVLCPQLSAFMGYHAYYSGTAMEPRADGGGITHEQWMQNDLPWVECADVVLRLPGKSRGADIETAHAEKHGIPVVHNIDDLPDPEGVDGDEVVETPWRYFIERGFESGPDQIIRIREGVDGLRYRKDRAGPFDAGLPLSWWEKTKKGSYFDELTEDEAAAILGGRPWETSPDLQAECNEGHIEQFASGSVRDNREGKGRYDLLPAAAIRRIAQHFERGAKKYGDRNWEKGQPISRYIDSGLRHVFNHLDGMKDEDHLAAAAWNVLAAIWTQEKVNSGHLPKELLS